MSRIERVRERISAWIWVIQLQAAESDRQTEGQNGRGIQMDIFLDDGIVGHAGAQSNGRFAVPKWIPGETDTGIEVGPPRIDAGLAGEPGIAWISKARRPA